MNIKRKGETVSFYLPGHYLVKLEERAVVTNSNSKDLCAKQLTIEALEDALMRELHYRLEEVEGKLERLLHHNPQSLAPLQATLAQAVFIPLHEAAGIDEADAANIANHLAPGSVRLPPASDLRQAC